MLDDIEILIDFLNTQCPYILRKVLIEKIKEFFQILQRLMVQEQLECRFFSRDHGIGTTGSKDLVFGFGHHPPERLGDKAFNRLDIGLFLPAMQAVTQVLDLDEIIEAFSEQGG